MNEFLEVWKGGKGKDEENARFLLSDALDTLELVVLQLKLVQTLAVVVLPVDIELLEVERVFLSIRLLEVNVVEKGPAKKKVVSAAEDKTRGGEGVRSCVCESLRFTVVLAHRVAELLLRLQVLDVVVALPVHLLAQLATGLLALALGSGTTSSTPLGLTRRIALAGLLRGAGRGGDHSFAGGLCLEGGLALTLALGSSRVGLAAGGEGSGIGLLRASLTSLREAGEGEGQREGSYELYEAWELTMVWLDGRSGV